MPPSTDPISCDPFAHHAPDQPLAVVWSGNPQGQAPTRLLRPVRTHTLAASATPAELSRFFEHLGWHRALSTPAIPPPPPMLAWLSYDLGRLLEPAAQHAARTHKKHDRLWPLAVVHECEDAIPTQEPHPPRPFRVGSLTSSTGQAAFEASVARVLDYIRAGDVYQANLAHRLSAPFEGCPRGFFRTLMARANPWHGFYSEHVDAGDVHILASASPELFLHLTPTRITTRPMKGTRPASPHGSRELASSAKDQAELAMIVDLMRNDLARISALGSVRVTIPRELEYHGGTAPGAASNGGGLLQATATITATPRPHVSLAEILAATFPPGSVTGAPKIRAMQIIDELEPHHRGPYCGAAGLITPTQTTLAVTIRTACITGRATIRDGALAITEGTLDWWVGAGIVADSTPREEWHETIAKASALHAALMG